VRERNEDIKKRKGIKEENVIKVSEDESVI
jgi:hypothetical protein